MAFALTEPILGSIEDSLAYRTEAIESALFMLHEQLRYTLANLEESNMNSAAVQGYTDRITSPIYGKISDTDGAVAELSLQAAGFGLRLTNDEGQLSSLSLTVGGLSGRVSNAEGNIASLSLTAQGLSASVSALDGSVSTLSQTVDGFSARITTAEGNASSAVARADAISLSVVSQTGGAVLRLGKYGTSHDDVSLTLGVTNSSGYSTLQLKSGNLILASSGNITLGGNVVFTGNLTDGTTSISGSNINTGSINAGLITTGTLDASRITVSNLSADSITSGTLSADRIDVSALRVREMYAYYGSQFHPILKAVSNTGLYLGGDGSWATKEVFLYAADNFYVGAYATWTYRMVFDTANREIRQTSRSNGWSLGNSTYYWSNAYLGADSVHLCESSAKLGFFGATAVVRQSLSTTGQNMGYSSATAYNFLTVLNNLCGILKNKYGLIG